MEVQRSDVKEPPLQLTSYRKRSVSDSDHGDDTKSRVTPGNYCITIIMIMFDAFVARSGELDATVIYIINRLISVIMVID